MVLGRSVAVLAVCLMSACGTTTARPAGEPAPVTGSIAPTKPAVPASGGAGYSAALSARLITAEALPPGASVQIATAMAADAGEQRPGADASCVDLIPLLSASRLTGTPTAIAAATLAFEVGPDDLWVGNEVLRTYADDGAVRALADLRALVARCPTVVASSGDRYRYAVAPGPRLGEDSIHLSCSSGELECDSVLVRAGTTLLVIQEQGNAPGGHRHLAPFAEAALRRYQTTGS
ncbi:hypothetical protein [Micromonospora sp. NPDC050495]|uniref:hypothetical protein n=1 Tax=Micromonospora sp. NPDC050495 TaxID=3154936 RepID=UPI0033CDF547